MVTKSKGKTGDKPKSPAVKMDISQLVVTAAYARKFSTGKMGFFGKAMNPANGKRYQIIGAVEIAG
jgi:hypothetical protein